MNRAAFVMHAGSGNHGCEAIVDSLVRMMPEEKFTLVTNSKKEDEQYLPGEVKARLDIEEEEHIADHKAVHALYYAARKITGDKESFLRYRFRPVTGKEKPSLAISIGGDNYCYESMVSDLMLSNSMFNRQGTKTILLGCSVEPELLKRADLVEDMNRYQKILARESLTYKALLLAGIPQEKVSLVPDPAFTLPCDRAGVPEEMKEGDTVGVNLSPMALDYSGGADTVMDAYEFLIRWILENSDWKVALIPHVVWKRSDDVSALSALKSRFEGEDRVFLIPDQRAERLKGVISSCRFFVGARTHATIAAYSTGVPTLTIGYSVKARGIAQDLFGEEEHCVLPVQSLRGKEQLKDAFCWIIDHEQDVRAKLSVSAKKTVSAAMENGKAVMKELNGQS